MTAIPRYPSDVTGAWLAEVLGRDGTLVAVEAVDVAPVGTGQTGATYRVAVTYAENPAQLPGTFILKLPATDDAVRDRVMLGYRSECAFYQLVAHRVSIPVPHCFHCDIAGDGAEYALLLADQAPAVQGNQIAGCGLPEANSAVRALAGLHAPTWCDPVWQSFPGLAMSVTTEDAIRGLGEIARMSAEITVDKLESKVSDADAETLRAAMSLVTPWLMSGPKRFALLHGDYRLDNLLFDGDRVVVVDWQTLGVGLAGRDLAYFTGTSMESGLRADVEEQLVTEYHRALLGHGVADYSMSDCWHDYRWGMVQAPLITALGCAFAVGTERGDDMMAAMLRRGCQAIRDLGTLEMINDVAD